MDIINKIFFLTAYFYKRFSLTRNNAQPLKKTITWQEISYQQPLGYKPKKIPKDRLLNSRPKKRKFELLKLSWIVVTVLVLLMFMGPKIASAAIPNEYAEAGQLLFKQSSHDYRPSLHLKTEADINISGMIATTRLQQTFKNTSDQWVEGIYVFPLPEHASITHLTIIVDDRKIVAEIKEKTIAKKIYNQAKSEGKKAAIIEQERENIFKQAVANIGPQEEITVELTFYQTIKYDNGYFEYRLPTTMTPRYHPDRHQNNLATSPSNSRERVKKNHETSSQTTDTTVDVSSGWSYGLSNIEFVDTSKLSSSNHYSQLDNPIKISVNLNPGLELSDIQGLYHEIKAERRGNNYKIITKEVWQNMNRDFVLNWQPASGASPSVALFNETVNNDTYGLLMLLPPIEEIQKIDRSVTFIIDTSGSMGGTSINQAKSALVLALRRLSKNDKFNIIEFNSNTRSLFTSRQHASQDNVSTAITFINSLNAGGGTEMRAALNAALTSKGEDNTNLKQIIFITDGSVANEQELLQLIHQKLDNARLFTVAIGSAPNNYFMKKAAQFGRGTSIHIGDINEVQHKMQKLFAKLENPALQNITIDWPTNIEAWPQKISDLYINEPIMIAYKHKQSPSKNATANIQGFYGDGGLWQHTLSINPTTNTDLNTGISKVWARYKIDSLMDKIVTGESENEIKPKVISIALEHNLISKYTSLVAIEKEISRPLQTSASVSNIPLSKPYGQTLITAPQTDTPKALHVVLGILLLIFGITFSRLGKRNDYV